MLTKVEIRNIAGALLTLTLGDVTDGFIVEEIQGLGPVKATIVSTSLAQVDGTQHQSSRRESRNLLFKIGLEPDYVTTSVFDLRSQLYNFFMTKTEVFMRFFVDNIEVNISGRVEACEPAIFSREPEVDISIVCFDPDFVSVDEIVYSGSTVSDSTEFLIDYPGTVEAAVLFTLNLDRAESEFTIYHRPPDNVVRSLDFAASLLDDDVLVIDSRTGNKGVTLTRTATASSLLYAMDPASSWIVLEPGENYLRVYTTGAAIPFTMAYTPRYGGL